MKNTLKSKIEEQYRIYMHDPDLLPEFIEATLSLFSEVVEEAIGEDDYIGKPFEQFEPEDSKRITRNELRAEIRKNLKKSIG